MVVVHRTTNEIPRRRKSLPLVDEDGLGSINESRWITLNDRDCRIFVKVILSCGALTSGASLTHGLCAFEADGGKGSEDSVKFLVNNSVNVLRHRRASSLISTLPLAGRIQTQKQRDYTPDRSIDYVAVRLNSLRMTLLELVEAMTLMPNLVPNFRNTAILGPYVRTKNPVIPRIPT
jgi:hypothetical protein